MAKWSSITPVNNEQHHGQDSGQKPRCQFSETEIVTGARRGRERHRSRSETCVRVNQFVPATRLTLGGRPRRGMNNETSHDIPCRQEGARVGANRSPDSVGCRSPFDQMDVALLLQLARNRCCSDDRFSPTPKSRLKSRTLSARGKAPPPLSRRSSVRHLKSVVIIRRLPVRARPGYLPRLPFILGV